MSTDIVLQTADYVKKNFLVKELVMTGGMSIGSGKTRNSLVWAEPVDMQVVQLAALLHDIADYKFHNGDKPV